MNKDLSGLTVLVIDDNAQTRHLLGRILQEFNVAKVMNAENGYDAIFEVANFGQGIDVILCDLLMPRVDGIEFMQRLKKGNTPDIPVIVVTGHADQGFLAKAAQIGVAGFLAKPVKPLDLVTRILKAVEARPRGGRGTERQKKVSMY